MSNDSPCRADTTLETPTHERGETRRLRFPSYGPAYGVFVMTLLFLSCSVSQAFEPVQAELGKEVAWTGEAVPLIITIYSPGPFSGTAAFDLPELPQTVAVKVGNPVVGSEDVDGESYLTQRHVFHLYTQQSGQVAIPSFRVRFSGKRTFTSDAEAMEGETPDLRWRSDGTRLFWQFSKSRAVRDGDWKLVKNDDSP